jgi:quercetin dioxygenase-like cupin family protein
MSSDRIFPIASFLQPADGEPVRSVITESPDAVVVAWYVKPGQRIAPHVHPQGQDTWTIVSGGGNYQLNAAGDTTPVVRGDIVVAPRAAVHGVYNDGGEPLVFVSVVCPGDAGHATF